MSKLNHEQALVGLYVATRPARTPERYARTNAEVNRLLGGSCYLRWGLATLREAAWNSSAPAPDCRRRGVEPGGELSPDQPIGGQLLRVVTCECPCGTTGLDLLRGLIHHLRRGINRGRVPWVVYESDVSFLRTFNRYRAEFDRIRPISEFFGSSATLPPVTFIDPNLTGMPSQDHAADDHPATDVRWGQAFLENVLDRLRRPDQVWAKTMLIITYDEHGPRRVLRPRAATGNADAAGLIDWDVSVARLHHQPGPPARHEPAPSRTGHRGHCRITRIWARSRLTTPSAAPVEGCRPRCTSYATATAARWWSCSDRARAATHGCSRTCWTPCG